MCCSVLPFHAYMETHSAGNSLANYLLYPHTQLDFTQSLDWTAGSVKSVDRLGQLAFTLQPVWTIICEVLGLVASSHFTVVYYTHV